MGRRNTLRVHWLFKMGPKKGLSLEEKRSKMLDIFHETKDVFLLKELEKVAPKMKGITSMSVKEVVTSLVDDGMVESEKIGTSVYFWAFPSKATQARRNKLESAMVKCNQLKKKLSDLETGILGKSCGREETDERKEVLEELSKEMEKRERMLNRLKDFAENDPAVLEQLVRETQEGVEATNRWTDNICSIRDWVKKKFSVDNQTFNKQFGIPEDLDYVQ